MNEALQTKRLKVEDIISYDIQHGGDTVNVRFDKHHSIIFYTGVNGCLAVKGKNVFVYFDTTPRTIAGIEITQFPRPENAIGLFVQACYGCRVSTDCKKTMINK
jgi:hypothetical protein